MPGRLGTGHPNVVPYQVFEASDGHIILGAANEESFRRFCEFAGCDELLEDPHFSTNAERVRNRAAANSEVQKVIGTNTADFWVTELSRLKITCSHVNTIDRVFEDPQVQARNMTMEMDHPLAGGHPLELIASPIKMSETPVDYRYPPPTLGQHTDEVLAEILDLDVAAVKIIEFHSLYFLSRDWAP